MAASGVSKVKKILESFIVRNIWFNIDHKVWLSRFRKIYRINNYLQIKANIFLFTKKRTTTQVAQNLDLKRRTLLRHVLKEPTQRTVLQRKVFRSRCVISVNVRLFGQKEILLSNVVVLLGPLRLTVWLLSLKYKVLAYFFTMQLHCVFGEYVANYTSLFWFFHSSIAYVACVVLQIKS